LSCGGWLAAVIFIFVLLSDLLLVLGALHYSEDVFLSRIFAELLLVEISS